MVGFLVIVIVAVVVLVLLARIQGLERRVMRLERSLADQRKPAAPEPERVARLAAAEPKMQDAIAPPRERVRALFRSGELEALIGGSLLNKAGAVVLVIGIALFLAYSFGRMTAAGRASLALAASAAILGAGIWTERRARYRGFARGLIGAGWAALYATAYAIYALPAARIIENPFAGSIGLLVVAAGMVGHSLRYRAQSVTSIAYFGAFVALAATPSTPFAVIGLIPLGASLLYLANAFEWNSMALFGLIATYATCMARGRSNAPLASTQSLFLVYWALFEAFDLLRARKRLSRGGVEWIAPLNALAFLGLSYTAWSHKAPQMLWLASAYGTALYLGDAIVRALLLPRSASEPNEDLAARMRQGSYEFSLAVAAALGGLAIVGKISGVWSSVWLASEAELLYLAGIYFRAGFVRGCGGAVFTFSLGRLGLIDSIWGHSTVLGHSTWNWTPPALFHAFLFYVNRALKRPNAIFSSAAAALIATALAAEMPERYLGASWLLFALALLELGLREGLLELRLQSYALAAAGAVASAYVCLAHHLHVQLSGLAIAVSTAYVCALRSRRQGSRLTTEERHAPTMFSLLGTGLMAALLYESVSGGLFTMALGSEGLALLGAGFALRERILRLQGLALLLACILKLFVYDLRNLETTYRILSFIALGIVLLCVSWIYTRFREQARRLL